MRIGVSLPVRELKDDLIAVRDFAQTAEGLGLTHLRVPEQVFREGSGPLPESLSLMSYIAGVTERIELCPSVIILPVRQTVLLAKQAATIDVLSGGRLRLGIGVGGSREEYSAMGVDFATRGKRCDEQMELLRMLWSQKSVQFSGRFHNIEAGAIDPLPVAGDIPIWIGARSVPSDPVVRRIGRWSNGWFVLCTPQEFPQVKGRIDAAAKSSGRDPSEIGTEAGVAVVGPRESEWKQRVQGWFDTGLSHLCLRTLGGDLKPGAHIGVLQNAVAELPVPNDEQQGE